jgi:hypothetical protein
MTVVEVVEVSAEVADSHSAETQVVPGVSNVEKRDTCPGNAQIKADMVVAPPLNALNAVKKVTFHENVPREAATSVSTARRKDTSHVTVRPSER